MSVLHGQAQGLGGLFYVPSQPLVIHPDKKLALSSEPEGQFVDDVPYGTAENPISFLDYDSEEEGEVRVSVTLGGAESFAQRIRETTVPRTRQAMGIGFRRGRQVLDEQYLANTPASMGDHNDTDGPSSSSPTARPW
ncbi:hypothetical protein Trisim1_010716 [Trichoderma cf. simile WF8]